MLKLIIAVIFSLTLLNSIGGLHPEELIFFTNLPAALFAFFIPMIFTIAHHSIDGLSSALSCALGNDKVSRDESIKHQSVISTFRVCISGGGVTGFLVGMIRMLLNMDNPKMIGPAMAVAVISALYSVILSELFIAPIINRLKQNTVEAEAEVIPLSTINYLTLLSIPFLITLLFILLLSFASFTG